MVTTVSKAANTAGTKRDTYKEPQRFSKAGLWRRENPGGIIIVHNRKAVNK